MGQLRLALKENRKAARAPEEAFDAWKSPVGLSRMASASLQAEALRRGIPFGVAEQAIKDEGSRGVDPRHQPARGPVQLGGHGPEHFYIGESDVESDGDVPDLDGFVERGPEGSSVLAIFTSAVGTVARNAAAVAGAALSRIVGSNV